MTNTKPDEIINLSIININNQARHISLLSIKHTWAEHYNNIMTDSLLSPISHKVEMERMKTEVVSDDDTTCSKSKSKNKKFLRFSNSSDMYIYKNDLRYDQSKSYTKSDKKRFNVNIIMDAVRLSRRLEACVLTGNMHLSKSDKLAACGIGYEEVVGIEHFLFSSPRDISIRRQLHAQVILKEYKEQLRLNKGCVDKEGCDDIHRRLRKLSILITKNARSQARQRATIARAA